MLRIIHTADWHLGHHFHGISRHYEHAQFFIWLLQQMESQQVYVLLVAGDVFDTANPAAAAQTKLYEFLVQATRRIPHLQIILTEGNHNSAAR